MATNVFIRLPLHALWLPVPPPCGVFWSLLPFSLPHWFDPAWQPLPRRWTSSWAGLVRSATARDSPHTVCCRSRDPAGYRRMPIPGFAVLELVGNSRMGVAIYEAGNEGPNTFATGHIYRLGNRGLLAVSYSMGTPAFCITLFGVRLMGSNVLKYTRDTSVWSAEYSGPWQPLLQRVQLYDITKNKQVPGSSVWSFSRRSLKGGRVDVPFRVDGCILIQGRQIIGLE